MRGDGGSLSRRRWKTPGSGGRSISSGGAGFVLCGEVECLLGARARDRVIEGICVFYPFSKFFLFFNPHNRRTSIGGANRGFSFKIQRHMHKP
jgi:hypothetical protein